MFLRASIGREPVMKNWISNVTFCDDGDYDRSDGLRKYVGAARSFKCAVVIGF
jgi:hypothetical protein